jgi:hypothetical protein
MRATVALITIGCAVIAMDAPPADAGQPACALPPSTASASFDHGGARYVWTTTCGGARVVIRGVYNDRTNRAVQIVSSPDRRGAVNRFELQCARNPWALGGRLPCTPVRSVVNAPAMLEKPWLGGGEIRLARHRSDVTLNRAAPGAPIPLLPQDASLVHRSGRTTVELRWTSSAGRAAVFWVELQRSMTPRGPWSVVNVVEVAGTDDVVARHSVPPRVFVDASYRHWRWRVGQAPDGERTRYSAWQTFSFR